MILQKLDSRFPPCPSILKVCALVIHGGLKHITTNNINCTTQLYNHFKQELPLKEDFIQWSQCHMSPRDSDTGVNRNSIMCMISQERQNVFTLQVSTQEATSCPAFFFFFSPTKGSTDSSHTNDWIK